MDKLRKCPCCGFDIQKEKKKLKIANKAINKIISINLPFYVTDIAQKAKSEIARMDKEA